MNYRNKINELAYSYNTLLCSYGDVELACDNIATDFYKLYKDVLRDFEFARNDVMKLPKSMRGF